MGKQLKSFEVMHSKFELLENELKMMKEKVRTEDKGDKRHSDTGENKDAKSSKSYKGYQLKDCSDEDMSTGEEDMPIGDLINKLNAVKAAGQKFLESDEESTVDASYPIVKVRKEQPQQSSPVKIFQPTVSVTEKFKEKKLMKTLTVMKRDNDTKNVRSKSTRVTKPGPSLLTPFRGTKHVVGITKNVNQPMTMVGRGYDPFAPVDVQKVKVLDDWLTLDEEYPVGSQNNGVEFFKILQTPQNWLSEEHINCAMNLLRLRFLKNKEAFRSEKLAFTDVYFTGIWSQSDKDFKESTDLPIFPNGSFDYASGKLPAFAQTGLKWRDDVDDIYGVLHVKKNHWVALFISIPQHSIDVFDCGLTGSTNYEIKAAVQPIAHMLPHLLKVTAPPSERPKISLQRFKIRRPRRSIPQMLKVGDCGIYAIKFIECHALRVEFTKPLSDDYITMIRKKLAVEIFDET